MDIARIRQRQACEISNVACPIDLCPKAEMVAIGLNCLPLPLRRTTGLTTYSGVIEKLLDDCEKRPIVSVRKAVESILRDVFDVKDLSSDQRYLYDITSAVISGECLPDLANRSPGKMSYAR
ncbi:hypothetical protein ILUMI_20578 [Ignelater luminosus]|uniref:Uncharacterized protein n=1 Tax=Ignelater luminosus TaxID=2038154 RepID=A0A8K0CE15_IGNLU|nr:hypothetical protein ILUMI_20578 [Ignelater luminosus]